jgi:hypothetical protein
MMKKEYSDEFKLEVVRAYLNGPRGGILRGKQNPGRVAILQNGGAAGA